MRSLLASISAITTPLCDHSKPTKGPSARPLTSGAMLAPAHWWATAGQRIPAGAERMAVAQNRPTSRSHRPSHQRESFTTLDPRPRAESAAENRPPARMHFYSGRMQTMLSHDVLASLLHAAPASVIMVLTLCGATACRDSTPRQPPSPSVAQSDEAAQSNSAGLPSYDGSSSGAHDTLGQDGSAISDLPAWIDRLVQSDSMLLTASITRTEQVLRHDRTPLRTLRTLHQFVELFMSPTEILLASWSQDDDHPLDHLSRPDYVMSFRKGWVREWLWADRLGAYETTSYPCPQPSGPSDFALLEDTLSCMIGTFSATWVGAESPRLKSLSRLHRTGELRPTLGANDTRTYTRIIPGRYSTRVDTYLVRDDVLVSWHTAETAAGLGDPNSRGIQEITQMREYRNVTFDSGTNPPARVHFLSRLQSISGLSIDDLTDTTAK